MAKLNEKRALELLSQLPPADWALKIKSQYEQTRAVRPEDLARLLGDQTKSVAMGADDLGVLLNMSR